MALLTRFIVALSIGVAALLSPASFFLPVFCFSVSVLLVKKLLFLTRTPCHLGSAFAKILDQVLNEEQLSSLDLPEMLETEMREALCPVLGERRGDAFAIAVRKSFVKHYASGRDSAAQTHQSSEHASNNTQLLQMMHQTLEVTSKNDAATQTEEQFAELAATKIINEESAASTDPEVLDDVTSRQSMSYSVDVEGGQSFSDLPLTAAFPAALATTTASALAPEVLEVMKRSVQAQERLVETQQRMVELKWIGLKQRGADMSRMMSLKEEEIKVAVKSTGLMEETIDLKRSKFEYEVMEAQNQATSIGSTQLCKLCADDLMGGMLVMTAALGYGTWMQSPRWFTQCYYEFQDKPRFSWQYMSWMLSTAEVLLSYLVCFLRGSLGILVGLCAFFLLASFVFRLLLNGSSTESKPGTVLIVVCGGLLGYAGMQTVNLLGGNGGNWFVLWEVLCCCHALANYKSKALFQFFGRAKHRSVVEALFHFGLMVVLPATVGLVAFPEALYKFS